jgi:hypothetical protein
MPRTSQLESITYRISCSYHIANMQNSCRLTCPAYAQCQSDFLVPRNSDIVARLSPLIPSCPRTLQTLMTRVRKPKARLQLSVYHTSSRDLSSQVRLLRLLTYIRPVILALAACQHAGLAAYVSIYSGSKGPTGMHHRPYDSQA